MKKANLVIKNAQQLIQPFFDISTKKAGVTYLENAYIACDEERIVFIGTEEEFNRSINSFDATIIDASGKIVLPGFIDAHTHPVFAETREREFEMRAMGKTYEQIASAGGGIRSSVRALRNSSFEQLVELGLKRLDRFLACGTTTIEAKSGYGLSLKDEIKILEVIRELDKLHPVDLVPTFLGAHEIPDEYRNKRDHYIDIVINEMIPAVAEQKLAVFCDVFYEHHVFNRAETERIIQAGIDYGLYPKLHVDQLSDGHGAELAADLNAVSADHLDYINEQGIYSLAEKDTVPVLLPGAVFFLGLTKYAPARKMIDAGLPVALATDFNPGSCPCQSIPMMMSIACTHMQMKIDEAVCAVTVHAASSIHKQNSLGTIKNGMQADLIVLDIPNYKLIPYYFGMSFVETVIKNGKLVAEFKVKSI